MKKVERLEDLQEKVGSFVVECWLRVADGTIKNVFLIAEDLDRSEDIGLISYSGGELCSWYANEVFQSEHSEIFILESLDEILRALLGLKGQKIAVLLGE